MTAVVETLSFHNTLFVNSARHDYTKAKDRDVRIPDPESCEELAEEERKAYAYRIPTEDYYYKYFLSERPENDEQVTGKKRKRSWNDDDDYGICVKKWQRASRTALADLRDQDRSSGKGSRSELLSMSKASGVEKLAFLRKTLDQFNVKRHEYQVDFHEEFIKSCLPKIFEKEWDSDYDAILEQFDMDRLTQEILVVTPRRFGKTYSIAMFCAAYLYCIPRTRIAIFSTGQRTARTLMLLVYAFLSCLNEFEDVVDTKNSETVILKISPTDTRELHCYPGTVAVRISIFLFVFFE